MGTETDQQQTTAAKKGHGASKAAPPKTPLAMSKDDHTAFVDLLLQQATESAKRAAANKDPKALVQNAKHAMSDVREALAAYAMPDTKTTPKQLFPSVDGAFMGLYDLFYTLRDIQDPVALAYAPQVQAMMVEVNDRFAPLGWKVPKSDAEGHARAKTADKAGATNLTAGERGRLGRMHIQAARQYLLGNWKSIVDGQVQHAAANAADNLRDAMSLLIDPHLAGEIQAATDEVAATGQVLERVFMVLQQHDASKIGELRELATAMDSLLGLVGKKPEWATRINTADPTTKSAASGTTNGPAGSGPSPVSNDVDRGAPRAEQGMHRIVEMRHFTRKVHIKDTNYSDEYLGFIELDMSAYRTASGQVYIGHAAARKKLEGRAGEYLSMGANVMANSIELKGERFCDVYFDIQIGGPNKTETTGASAGAKVSAQNESKTAGAEASAGVVFSTAVSSQGTRAFRRVFRINSLGKPLTMVQVDPSTKLPTYVETGMVETERPDMHQDFSNFELDDDDVGDGVTSFYANWVLHSYSD